MSTIPTSTTPSSTSAFVPFTVNPTSTDGPNTAPQSGNGTSSSLYLFTFLATLLLLLCVSSAIILRSFILRRRFRRRVESALLQGAYDSTYDPFRPAASRRRPFYGAKPRIFDVFPRQTPPASWRAVVPVSAAPLHPAPEKLESRTAPASASTPETSPPRRTFLARLNPFARRPDPSPLPTTSTPLAPPPPPPLPDAMQVTLLIAMPDARRVAYEHEKLVGDDADEDEKMPLPEMVLGTAEVPYRGRP